MGALQELKLTGSERGGLPPALGRQEGGCWRSERRGKTSYPTFWMRCPRQLRGHPFCVHKGLWGSNRRKRSGAKLRAGRKVTQ